MYQQILCNASAVCPTMVCHFGTILRQLVVLQYDHTCVQANLLHHDVVLGCLGRLLSHRNATSTFSVGPRVFFRFWFSVSVPLGAFLIVVVVELNLYPLASF